MSELHKILERAEQLEVEGNIDDALLLTAPAIAVCRVNYPVITSDFQSLEGVLLRMQGKYEAARDSFGNAFVTARTVFQKANARVGEADIARVYDDNQGKAMDLATQAYKFAGDCPLTKSYAMHQKGLIYYGMKEYDDALHEFTDALEILDSLGELLIVKQPHIFYNRKEWSFRHVKGHSRAAKLYVQNLVGLCSAYNASKENSEVILEIAEHALDIAKSMDYQSGIGNALHYMYEASDDSEEGINWLLQAYNRMRDSHNNRHLAAITLNLAHAYSCLDQAEKAQEYFSEFTSLKSHLTGHDLGNYKAKITQCEQRLK